MNRKANRNFLAIDLGASSGRAMLGRLSHNSLSLAEVHRFENRPVSRDNTLRWDLAGLEREIRRGVELARAQAGELDGLGIDSWGVDYVLLGASGTAIEPPFHYRDGRTDGVLERVCQRVGRETLFGRTGIQFLPFNTIYQLAAHDPHKLHHAAGLLMIADYFAYRLGGRPVGEITLASTSQMLDARTRSWAFDLIDQLELPSDLMPELVEAGRLIGDCDGVPVIATAAHDTAAAVAGCPANGNGSNGWAFLSSGTWSLLGIELHEPVLSAAAMAANLSNEAGVGGTTRLLRNIMGLWLLQECRRQWAEAGRSMSWADILTQAEDAAAFVAVVDADDPTFLAPGAMADKIADYCKRTGQRVPDGVGETARVALEAIALKTRCVLDRLQQAAGRNVQTIHLVGGGVNNHLLCQWTANATGRRVLAGPVEATAAGNVLTQALGAGVIDSLAAGRAILRNSVSLAEYTPRATGQWQDAQARLERLIDGGASA